MHVITVWLNFNRATGHADAPKDACNLTVVAAQGGIMQARVFWQMIAIAYYTPGDNSRTTEIVLLKLSTARETTESKCDSWQCHDLAPSHPIAPSPDKMMVTQSVQHRLGVLLMLCGQHD